jgi:cytochrome b561
VSNTPASRKRKPLPLITPLLPLAATVACMFGYNHVITSAPNRLSIIHAAWLIGISVGALLTYQVCLMVRERSLTATAELTTATAKAAVLSKWHRVEYVSFILCIAGGVSTIDFSLSGQYPQAFMALMFGVIAGGNDGIARAASQQVRTMFTAEQYNAEVFERFRQDEKKND